MNPLQLPTREFIGFVLILVRVGAILMGLPVLGNRSVPMMVKAGMSLLLAMVVFPSVDLRGVPIPKDNFPLVLALMSEIGIGLLIGYLARLVFSGIQVAGQLIGYQMGFGIVSILDPQTSSQLSIIAVFENMLALLLFLSLNIHHVLIQAIAESFRLIPLMGGHYPIGIMEKLVRKTADLFVISVKIGAPVMAVLLFINLSMGMSARTVPQMNVFIVAFPVQIGAGLIMLGLSLPVSLKLFQQSFVMLEHDVGVILRLIRVG